MNKAGKIVLAIAAVGAVVFSVVSALNLGEGLRQGKAMGKKQTKYI